MGSDRREAFVDTSEIRLRYLDWGGPESPVIVLLHGLTSNANAWDPLAVRLRSSAHVIAMDQRGHGDSSHAADYSVKSFGSDIRALAMGLGIGRFDLVGHSLGARTATAFAGDHSAMLGHLILSEFGPEQGRKASRAVMDQTAQRPQGFRSRDAALQWHLDTYPKRQRKFLEARVEGGFLSNYAGKLVWKDDPELLWITGSFGAKEVPYLWEQWRRIDCPILVVRGKESENLTADIGRRMIDENANATLVEVDGAGHGVPQEKPLEFEALVRDFLGLDELSDFRTGGIDG